MITPDEFFKNGRKVGPTNACLKSENIAEFLAFIERTNQKMYRDQSVLANQIPGYEIY